MASVKHRIEEMGARVFGVAPAAAFQAKKMLARGYPFPLFLDPEHRLYGALALKRQSVARLFYHPRGWVKYLGALARNRRQGLVTGGPTTLPGVAVVDASGELAYVHRGEVLGDYPPLETVLQALARKPD